MSFIGISKEKLKKKKEDFIKKKNAFQVIKICLNTHKLRKQLLQIVYIKIYIN